MQGNNFLDIIKIIAAWIKKTFKNLAAWIKKAFENLAAWKQKMAKQKADKLKRKLEKARMRQELCHSRRYLFAVIAIFIAVVIIIAIDSFCVWLIVKTEKDAITSIADAISTDALNHSCEVLNQSRDALSNSFDIAQERTLLSTGLSIIGIAISVWATLNILNSFDKKDLIDMERQVNKLSEKYSSEIDQINENSRNTFLYYIEQYSKDVATEHIANKFVGLTDVPYSQLSLVMMYYSRIYHKYHLDHQADQSTVSNIFKEAIDYTEELLKANPDYNDTVKQFLHFCLGDMYFYRAYYYKEKERYDYSMRAIEEYDLAKDLFGVTIPKYDSQYVDSVPYKITIGDHSEQAIPLLAYLCNTYGECYSKAVKGYKDCNDKKPIVHLDSIKNKAVFYCRYAVTLTNSQNEIYLRNLGCALEAANGTNDFADEIAKDIAKQYQDAMDVSIKDNNIPWKVFHTWLSFYHKCINQQINGLLGKQKPADWLGKQKPIANNTIYNNFETALTYANLACQTYPNDLRFLKFRAFVLRDRCIWEVKRNGKSDLAKQYYDAFQEVFQALTVLFRKDSDKFMEELSLWDEALTHVLKQETKSEKTEAIPV